MTTASTVEPAPAQYDAQRRRVPRYRCDMDGALYALTPDAPAQAVRIFDMSLMGIGLHSPLPLPLASIWRIEIDSPRLRLNSRLRITRCHQQTTGFDVGGEFIED